MANSNTTVASDSSESTGTALPLAYGYVWGTGKRAEYYEIQNTGNSGLDYTRVGRWILGDGEEDGCEELWINDTLVWNGNATIVSNVFGLNWFGCLDGSPQDIVFNFHRGSDAVIGSGLIPSSYGPDQGADILFAQYPSAINPTCANRQAYYMIFRKQPIQNQTNTHQDDPTQWTDIAPIGLWRGQRCRIFDVNGNQVGYAFTTNPAWHFVDVLLRRKIFPDFNIDLDNGPTPLPPAAVARFNWASIYNAATYYNQILANGRRRFEGNYLFNGQTSLTAILEQILLNCRSYTQEYAGQIYLECDQPRGSVFTFSREHIVSGALEPNDQKLHLNSNAFVGKMRDLLVPVASVIASISTPNHTNPTVTTEEPHCLNNGDWIVIGGTNTPFDRKWQVAVVPAVIDAGTPEEVDPSTFTMVSQGSNFPVSVGSGGVLGLCYSRFKERAPVFQHKANQLTRGAAGLGLPRLRERTTQSLDFAVSTFDQVSRIVCYERDKVLGVDVLINVPPANYASQLASTPYQTPQAIDLRRVPLVARDVYGNLAGAIQPGAHVTIDNTASWAFPGEYEVTDITFRPFTAQPSSGDGSLALMPSADGGELDFTLIPYNEAFMYDTSDPLAPGWEDVPGSDPGSGIAGTEIALLDNGVLAVISGQIPSGTPFQLPATGFDSSNLIAWASPGGYIELGRQCHTISLCTVNSDRTCILNYYDEGGVTGYGDVNYFALTWQGNSSAVSSATAASLNFNIFTLAGGEEICFGYGVVAHGSTVAMPAGFSFAKAFTAAYPHDGIEDGGNVMHWVGAYIDSFQNVNFTFKDGEGNKWHGDASALLFGWKNNSGTVTVETVGGIPWMIYLNSDGYTLGVGLGSMIADGGTFTLPAEAGGAGSLQLITGPHTWDYPDNGHPAHGISACWVDSSNIVHVQFQDGEGNIWEQLAMCSRSFMNRQMLRLSYRQRGYI